MVPTWLDSGVFCFLVWSPRSQCQHGRFWCFLLLVCGWLSFHCILTRREQRDRKTLSVLSSLIRALIPFTRALISWLNYLPKAPLANTITLEMTVWKNNFESIALGLDSFSSKYIKIHKEQLFSFYSLHFQSKEDKKTTWGFFYINYYNFDSKTWQRQNADRM